MRDENRPTATAHMPGIDGLRGLLVPIILTYHLGVAGFGGFLALEGFFVLSGFLITLLLLDNPPQGPRELGRWWMRRWRRLLPAATVVVATTVLLFARTPGIARDAVSTLMWWRNWEMAFGTTSYWSTAPSPLKHAWSLSVEEQFYLVFPLLLIGAIAFGRRIRWSPRAAVGVACATLAVVGYGWQAWLASGTDDLNRVYLGTDTRGGSILLGCAVGALVHGSRSRRSPTSRLIDGLVVIGLVTIAVLGFALEIEGIRTYQGGLFAAALAWAALTVGASRPGPFATALSVRPLQWMGVRSYGIYLWSWPVQVFAQTRWPSLGLAGLAAITVPVSFVLGDLSLRLVERPLRGRVGWAEPAGVRRAAWVGGLAIAVLAVSVVALQPPERDSVVAMSEESTTDAAMSSAEDLLERSRQGATTTSTPEPGTSDPPAPAASPGSPAPTAPTEPPTSAAPEPLTVLVGGDSQASTMAAGVDQDELPDHIAVVANAGVLGCGLLVRTPGWMVNSPAHGGLVDGSYCRGAGSAEDAEVIGLSARPDWLVITSGGYEQAHAYRSPDGRMLPARDPEIRRAVTDALELRIERANAHGTRVALLEFACPGREPGETGWDEFTRTSIEWHNSILEEVAAANPGTITIPPSTDVCSDGDAAGRPTPAKAEAWGTDDRVHVTDRGQGWVWQVQIGPALWAASVGTN